jgi:tetratricopeptide (TPR) repeat protein
MEDRLVKVQYRNNHEGLVDDVTLDELIRSRKVIRFYRPSQDAWVDVETGSVRSRENHYSGPERRAHDEEDAELSGQKPHGLLSKMLRRKQKPTPPKALTAHDWFERGFLALHCDDHDDATALKAFARSISLDPDNERSYLNRAITFEKIGNLHQAIDDYRQAIALAPRDAKLYYLCGMAHKRLGQEDEALKDLEQAARLAYRPALDFFKSKGIFF